MIKFLNSLFLTILPLSNRILGPIIKLSNNRDYKSNELIIICQTNANKIIIIIKAI